MLLAGTAERVYSWLGTVSAILHRKIGHERVLRQLLMRRYGAWIDFWSTSDLIRILPVFYRHRTHRYFLLRDVIPFLPKVRHQHNSVPRPQTHRTPRVPAELQCGRTPDPLPRLGSEAFRRVQP
jgi:hypothetical protein